MMKFSEALALILSHARKTAVEDVALDEACNRVLAQDALSDLHLPPFNRATMDGFACRKEDIKSELSVIATIPAGSFPDFTITKNQCARIMTGAPVPEGADCVIMVEQTKEIAPNQIIFIGEDTATNISPKGEDVKPRDKVLNCGTLLAPQHIAILAATGTPRPQVYARAKVSLLVTGDELSVADKSPSAGHIRDSNSPQLKAQIAATGASLHLAARVGDDLETLRRIMKTAMEESDLILLSGGVSMGDFDFVPQAIKDLGGEIMVEKVAIKPGKPSKFAVFPNGTCCLGLPGNPVSSFVQFEMLAKPLLYKMMGHDFRPALVEFALANDFSRKDTLREEWLPVKITTERMAEPIKQNTSGHIASLAYADGLMKIEQSVATVKAGEKVSVRLLRA